MKTKRMTDKSRLNVVAAYRFLRETAVLSGGEHDGHSSVKISRQRLIRRLNWIQEHHVTAAAVNRAMELLVAFGLVDRIKAGQRVYYRYISLQEHWDVGGFRYVYGHNTGHRMASDLARFLERLDKGLSRSAYTPHKDYPNGPDHLSLDPADWGEPMPSLSDPAPGDEPKCLSEDDQPAAPEVEEEDDAEATQRVIEAVSKACMEGDMWDGVRNFIGMGQQ